MTNTQTNTPEWFSAAELAALGLPGLPSTKRGVQGVADREGWADQTSDTVGPLARTRKGRGGGMEFHASVLPEAARVRLAAGSAAPRETLDREAMWARWEQLPAGLKETARSRLAVIDEVERLMRGGLGKDAAIKTVVAQLTREERLGGEKAPGCSVVYDWFRAIHGAATADRAAYLAPNYQGRRADRGACSGDAWEFYKGDYLRPSRPTHASCYGRLQRLANDRGWSLPSAKTLQRRLEAEVPAPVQFLLRYGEEALDHSFPHLERDRSGITPMRVLNLDGHTWDVRVLWPDGTISRPHGLAVQDIASGKMLALRHDMTLNHHLVRLALGDTFRDYGLPDIILMDNGRENAAQAISGGQRRLRWGKTPEEESAGLLKTLGVKAIAVTAYRGQAKPIERAFRNFAHDLAKSPEFEGAYTGHNPVSKPDNYGERAIPLAEFEAIVQRELAHYNARAGRRGQNMHGRSFDQVFAEGVQRANVRQLTPVQLRMCLLASKLVTMDPRSGAVTVEGHRYWSPELGDLKRQQVTVRFDPEAMDRPAYVYDKEGRFLAEAARLQAGSFDRASDARGHMKALRDHKRAKRDLARSIVKLTPRDLAAQLAGPPLPEAPAPADDKVITLDFTIPRTAEQLGQPAAVDPDYTAAWERSVASAASRG
jgi:hypothetical protein